MKKTIFSYGLQCILVWMLASTGLFAPVVSGVQAASPTAENALLNQINGAVALDAGGVPAGAQVLAWRGDKSFTAAVDPSSGAYSLAVGSGDWNVTLTGGVPGLTSPAWVYTAGPQAVSFSANPDPLAPVKVLNFQATQATEVISGTIVPPAPGGALAAPNRVWVRAENQEGIGNTVLADPITGAFSVNVLPGNTLLKLAFENARWAPPATLAGSIWYIAAGGTASAGLLQLVQRNASINGVVLDQDLVPVAGMPVRAWRLDGSETATTLTGTDGTFTLWAIPGVWEVQVTPPAASPYTPAQNPQRINLVGINANQAIGLKVYLADVTVQGTLVDGSGVPVSGLDGHIVALYKDGVRWPQFGPGAAIKASAFTLKLSSRVAQDYILKGSFPTTSGYSVIGDVNLHNVTAGQTYTVTLPVAANNSSISGQIFDHDSGLVKLGLPGAIYGASDSGALKRARLNPLDGSYQIQAAATDTAGHGGTFWFLHAFVDPVTGFQVMKPRSEIVFLPYNEGNGADVTANFTVAAVNSVITGKVVDEHGTPTAGVKVSVVEQGSPAGLAYRRWDLTNTAGRFSIPVPAGVYRVSADFRNWIAPLPLKVSIGSHTIIDINTGILHGDWVFRQKDALISGQVTYAGSGHIAFLRAYSDSGAAVVGETNSAGHYQLAVNSGEPWHVQAVSEEGAQFLKSARVKVETKPGSNPGVDLDLLASETLPENVIFTFDSTQDQSFTLSNGAQVSVPAGAMASSGAVTLVVQPLAELADDGGAQPVSFGYRLLAFDENHVSIDRFNAPVTLSMPFSAAQLQALGVMPDALIPSYWDISTSSWKPVPNYSLQVNPDGSGALNLVVDHFTDYGMLSLDLPYKLFVPQVRQ